GLIVVPWLLGQIPAAFLVAGLYGVLEGWLAVDGSPDWGPMSRLSPPVDDARSLGSAAIPMRTVLDGRVHPSDRAPLPRRRTPPKIRRVPLATGGVLAAIGIGWYCATVVGALANHPLELGRSTIDTV